jgi:hypothetical protein
MSSPKVYQVMTLEDEDVFTTRDLTFPKKSSPQVATTLRRISQDPESDLGSTRMDQKLQAPSTTTSVHTRILAEDFISYQEWYRYLLQYLDEAVTFYNPGYPVVRQLVVTIYEIMPETRQLPPTAPQASVNSQYYFYGFANSELYDQPSVVPRHIVLRNPTSDTTTSSSRPSERMNIDSPPQTVKYTGRVSHSPGERWVAPTTKTATTMRNFNNLVIDPNNAYLERPQYATTNHNTNR